MRLACIAFVTCAGLPTQTLAQTIEVTPSRVLVDQPAVIHVSGAQPNERLTIRAELVDAAGGRWASQSEFVADADGRIDTAKQAPVGGSYKEVSAMGPVWSMKPVASGSASNKEGRYEPPRQFGVQTIEFHLTRGTNIVSTANLEQTPIGEGVQRVTVREDGLRGILRLMRQKHAKAGRVAPVRQPIAAEPRRFGRLLTTPLCRVVGVSLIGAIRYTCASRKMRHFERNRGSRVRPAILRVAMIRAEVR